jgi:hypothetical protein
MSRRRILIVLAVAAASAGALLVSGGSEPSRGPAGVKQRLQAIAESTVLFGHQSVGSNVLDGLGALAREEGVELRIAEVRSAAELRPGTFGHVFVAANGDPRRKLGSFTAALAGGVDPEIALLKFCFVDFDANADARALFAQYEATLRDLRAKHPRTTFVHVTVPLVADEGLLKSLAKKLLGKSSGAVPSNARREEFNALLRSAFPNEPLFDLARIESTDSSGRPVSAKLGDQVVPMLAREYTEDGGHLNAAGSWRAAVALVNVLGDALMARAEARSGG